MNGGEKPKAAEGGKHDGDEDWWRRWAVGFEGLRDGKEGKPCSVIEKKKEIERKVVDWWPNGEGRWKMDGTTKRKEG